MLSSHSDKLLLVVAADSVWDIRDVGLIDDELVTIAWLLIAISSAEYLCRKGQSRATHRRPIGPDREP